MTTSPRRATLPQQSSHLATSRGTKENSMKTSSSHLRTFLITLGLGTLALVGMRCNGFTPGGEAYPKATTSVPRYTSERVIGPVEWPSVSSVSQTALAQIKTEERAKVSLSGVPVLVPSDPKLLAAGIMMHPTDVSYGFGSTEPVNGLDFTIDATNVSTRSNAPVPAYLSDPNRPKDDYLMIGKRKVSIGWITGDGGREGAPLTADWVENGDVAYSIVLVCSTINDQRCLQDSYVRSFIESLVYVGGSGK